MPDKKMITKETIKRVNILPVYLVLENRIALKEYIKKHP